MLTVAQLQEVQEKAQCLHDAKAIEAALDKLAVEITKELGKELPLVMSVMTGALVPLGMLLPRLNFPLEIDYVHATRYRGNTHGSHLHWRVEPSTDLENRTVLIFDDILDGGITLAAIKNFCEAKGAKKVYTAVLADKPTTRLPEGLPHADFVGLEVGDHYVFGCGLDYKEYLRNVPGIYAIAPEHI